MHMAKEERRELYTAAIVDSEGRRNRKQEFFLTENLNFNCTLCAAMLLKVLLDQLYNNGERGIEMENKSFESSLGSKVAIERNSFLATNRLRSKFLKREASKRLHSINYRIETR